MEQIFFITSATVLVPWTFNMTGLLFGNSMEVPVPILHIFKEWSFTNTYLSTPAIAYQIYFWSNYVGIFNV